MDIKNRFALIFAICTFASFAQSVSAQESGTENSRSISEEDDATDEHKKKNFKSKGDDFIDNLMEKIPYSHSLKYTWHVVDGEVDLYFEGLRVDRKNQGVSYRLTSLPMLGALHGSELNAALGEENRLTFTSDYMPLVGRLDGLEFKASAGTGDSHVSLRYKSDISW